MQKESTIELCYNLELTELEPINIYPLEQNLKEESDFKIEERWDGDVLLDESDDDDKPLVMLRGGQHDDIKKDISENISSEERPIGLDVYEKCIEQKVDHEFIELPPSCAKTRDKKRSRLKIDNEALEDIVTKLTSLEEPKQKVLRNGFTSRMVQETDEYLVIKLTKEQVVEEMVRRKSDTKYKRAPFKCEYCVKGFNFEDVLDNHMKKHSSVCGEIRLSRQHLLEHHALSHSGRVLQYACKKCNFNTNKRTVLQRHFNRHASDSARSCKHCGRVCTTVQSLRAHMLKHERDKRHACEKCGKSFIYPSLLEAHEKTHSTGAPDWYCVECDIHFKTQDNLRTHFKKSAAHRDPSILKYSCKWCDKKCMSEAALVAHHAAAHGTAKTHVCTLCEKAYSSADGLRAHSRRVHGPPAPASTYSCDICSKTFTSRSSSVRHRRVHTGERPYACAACGARFGQPSTLRTHCRLRHDIRSHTGPPKATRTGLLVFYRRTSATLPASCFNIIVTVHPTEALSDPCQ
ncbi:Zinc finger protein 93 [Eumeta japonica]|uniref:Zinc finger protein 93 n=1 Tax=Eumeta variegata TaxID=151549 RepID=A0A4C2A538_EUMVA|nr:Zinc finger protein 93 [Eumeta japonica]